MGKTTSTHNGSAANREHNIRNKKATGKMEHINKDLEGQNEILIDEKPRDAYKRIFGKALSEYNAKQNRPERQIKDYYNHVVKDDKKNAVYEMIVQIGDKNDTGINAPEERAVIKEFVVKWNDRNPNLELIGAYIHADEHEGTLHAHLDYVPVAHNYTRGLSVQNGLVKALGEQGFKKDGKETAQIQWQKRENKALGELCKARGIEIINPKEKRKHLDTEQYKKLADMKEKFELLQEEYQEVITEAKTASETVLKFQKELSLLENKKKTIEGEIGALEKELKGKILTYSELYKIKPRIGFGGSLKDITIEDIENLKKTAIEYDKVKNQLYKVQGLYEDAKRFIPTMAETVQKGRDRQRLEVLEKAFERLPENIREQLIPVRKASSISKETHRIR